MRWSWNWDRWKTFHLACYVLHSTAANSLTLSIHYTLSSHTYILVHIQLHAFTSRSTGYNLHRDPIVPPCRYIYPRSTCMYMLSWLLLAKSSSAQSSPVGADFRQACSWWQCTYVRPYLPYNQGAASWFFTSKDAGSQKWMFSHVALQNVFFGQIFQMKILLRRRDMTRCVTLAS